MTMTEVRYFDAHTHVNFAAFEDDRDEVISRAHEAGVFLINVGTQKDTSKSAVELARKYETGVWATVGIHPIHTDASYHDADELGSSDKEEAFTSRGEDFDYEYYLKLAHDPKVVAIGECGLDYYRVDRPETTNVPNLQMQKQKEVFDAHIELAYEVEKPLMLHCRDAYDDLVPMLRERKGRMRENAGIAHFFAGTKDHAKGLLDLGFSFTFGGVITFVRDYDEIVRYIPNDRILSETDAPYVTPAPHRGGRNEPLYVIELEKKLAELKGVLEEDMAGQIWENAERIFGI